MEYYKKNRSEEFEHDKFISLVAYIFYKDKYEWTEKECKKILKRKKIKFYEIYNEKNYIRVFVVPYKKVNKMLNTDNYYAKFEYILPDVCANTIYEKNIF